jgi:hypothetical protein
MRAESRVARVRRTLSVRWKRGQAMVEYSAVVFFLALAGGVSIITVIPMLMSALNKYLQGIYFMLNMPVP